jgi:hypothetical protein
MIAYYIKNKIPIKPKGIILKKAYSRKKLYIGHLRAWECLAYYYIPLKKRYKLEFIVVKTYFIGYIFIS